MTSPRILIVDDDSSFRRVLEYQLKQAGYEVLKAEDGKEVLAKAIHYNSARSYNPFIIINCGAIPDTLLESEFFGYRKGAFTGATANRIGKFEAAYGGTVFLDEIGDLPAQLQVKVLRVVP
jgi:DNA-binding NtrC family response regulator